MSRWLAACLTTFLMPLLLLPMFLGWEMSNTIRVNPCTGQSTFLLTMLIVLSVIWWIGVIGTVMGCVTVLRWLGVL